MCQGKQSWRNRQHPQHRLASTAGIRIAHNQAVGVDIHGPGKLAGTSVYCSQMGWRPINSGGLWQPGDCLSDLGLPSQGVRLAYISGQGKNYDPRRWRAVGMT